MDESTHKPKAAMLAAIVDNERLSHERKCSLFFAGIWFGVLVSLALAAPLALTLFGLISLKNQTLSILAGLAAPTLTATGWLFVSWMSALDCVQRLKSSLIAAEHEDAAFASELFRQAPCVGDKTKLTVVGVARAIAGV